jgi:hypothetical protein
MSFERNESEVGAQRARFIPRATFKQGRPVSRDTSFEPNEKRNGAPRAPPAPDFQRRPVSRDNEHERSEAELERETGRNAPSTNHSVKFIYRYT